MAYIDQVVACRDCAESYREKAGCREHEKPEAARRIACKQRWYIYRCPHRVISPTSAEYLRHFSWLETGGFAGPGTWQEQPAKLIHALEILRGEINRAEIERMKQS